MADAFAGIDAISRRIKNINVGVDNINHKILNGYVGVGGFARRFYSGNKLSLTYEFHLQLLGNGDAIRNYRYKEQRIYAPEGYAQDPYIAIFRDNGAGFVREVWPSGYGGTTSTELVTISRAILNGGGTNIGNGSGLFSMRYNGTGWVRSNDISVTSDGAEVVFPSGAGSIMLKPNNANIMLMTGCRINTSGSSGAGTLIFEANSSATSFRVFATAEALNAQTPTYAETLSFSPNNNYALTAQRYASDNGLLHLTITNTASVVNSVVRATTHVLAGSVNGILYHHAWSEDSQFFAITYNYNTTNNITGIAIFRVTPPAGQFYFPTITKIADGLSVGDGIGAGIVFITDPKTGYPLLLSACRFSTSKGAVYEINPNTNNVKFLGNSIQFSGPNAPLNVSGGIVKETLTQGGLNAGWRLYAGLNGGGLVAARILYDDIN